MIIAVAAIYWRIWRRHTTRKRVSMKPFEKAELDTSTEIPKAELDGGFDTARMEMDSSLNPKTIFELPEDSKSVELPATPIVPAGWI